MDLILFTRLTNFTAVSQDLTRSYQTVAIGAARTAERSFNTKLDFQSWTRANNNFHPRYISQSRMFVCPICHMNLRILHKKPSQAK